MSGLPLEPPFDLQQCLIRDKHYLLSQWRKLRNAALNQDSRPDQDNSKSPKPPKPPKPQQSGQTTKLPKSLSIWRAKLQDRWQASHNLWQKRQAALPAITYPNLPVTQKVDDLKRLIQQHQVIVLAGETGSGKTTQLPKLCLEAGLGVRGMIGHTQPRRLAATSVAARVASELNVTLGEQIGYQVRFKDKTAATTLVKLMTDGILLAEIRQDPYLLRYDTIIIDEAHERSLNIDFLLGYIRRLLPKRPDLTLIITSATIDVDRFSEHFHHAPVVKVSGRTYPVEVWYRPLVTAVNEPNEQPPKRVSVDVNEGVLQALMEIDAWEKQQGKYKGDVLVFMPGERDIRDLANVIRQQNTLRWQVLPLYGRLSVQEQNKIFNPQGSSRRIVLATNVAETSITVPGIGYVIDSGMARISRYSYRAKIQRLPIEPISQASANQRTGRCGRVGEGICIRLYEESDFNNRSEFTEAEITRTNLAAVILQMHDLKLGHVSEFPFIDKPSDRFIKDGTQLLQELGALNEQQKLTPLGRQLARLPIDPRIARMVLAATEWGSLKEVLVIGTALAIQDPRERPADKQQAATQKHQLFQDKLSDFISLFNIWQAFEIQRQELSQKQLRQWCSLHFISYTRMIEWRAMHRQVWLTCQSMELQLSSEAASYMAIHRALLTGLLHNIGHRHLDGHYMGIRQRQFYIYPGSSLHKQKTPWVMAAELVETSRLFARNLAKIEPEWIEQAGQHWLKRSYSEPRWHKRQGRVLAYEKVTLHGLVLASNRKVAYTHIDPDICQHLLIMEGLVTGEFLTKGGFLKHNQNLVKEIEVMEAKTRKRDWLADDEALYDFYATKFAALNTDSTVPITTAKTFEKLRQQQETQHPEWLFLRKQDILLDNQRQLSKDQFPDYLSWQGHRWPLIYRFEPGHPQDGVTIKVTARQLKHIPSWRLSWLVPGLLVSKIETILRALPKAQRKHLVPITDAAADLGASLTVEMDHADELESNKNKARVQDKDLMPCLAKHITRYIGRPFELEWLQSVSLDPLYSMGIELVNEEGKAIAYDRNLQSLLDKTSEIASASTHTQAHPLLQTGLTALPQQPMPSHVQLKEAGGTYTVWPAIQDKGKHVDVVFADSLEQANSLNRGGIIRLIKIALSPQIKYLTEQITDLQKLSLMYINVMKQGDKNKISKGQRAGSFGTHTDVSIPTSLEADVFTCVIRDLFLAKWSNVPLDEQNWPKDEATMTKLLEQRGDLEHHTSQLVSYLMELLQHYQEVLKQLKDKQQQGYLAWTQVCLDMQNQLNQLIYPSFILMTPRQHLNNMLRYLKAMQSRLERFPQRLSQENAQVKELQQWQQDLHQAQENCSPYTAKAEALQDFFWQLQEYRVSLFAQQLGTPHPVSSQRLQKQWQQIKQL